MGSQGLLVTNFHVVEGTTAVGIKLSGTEAVILATKVRAYDSDNDLAVLQVDGVSAQPVALGDSDEVTAGQSVVVVGNPEGLEQTVSNGLVSAIREVSGRTLFQISAPVSEGSSGSPVFDDHGEVIGVVVGSIEAGQNLNFAVPINYAKPLLKSGAEQPISSLPKRSPVATSQGAVAAEPDPTLGETLKWHSICPSRSICCGGRFAKGTSPYLHYNGSASEPAHRPGHWRRHFGIVRAAPAGREHAGKGPQRGLTFGTYAFALFALVMPLNAFWHLGVTLEYGNPLPLCSSRSLLRGVSTESDAATQRRQGQKQSFCPACGLSG